jgi:hypothetical protein
MGRMGRAARVRAGDMSVFPMIPDRNASHLRVSVRDHETPRGRRHGAAQTGRSSGNTGYHCSMINLS